MNPADFFADIVQPSLARLEKWTGVGSDDRAHALVMAIAGQETAWKERLQDAGGPARSYWQFELGGGVAGVFNGAGSRVLDVCAALDVPALASTVFQAMAWNDTLACCMARLNLWLDPEALPPLTDCDGAYQYYLRTWRPGMPRRESWNDRHATALALVKG
jgi:hypothetical protein